MRYLISICICLLLVAPCMAETINVDANSSVDFNNIQAAINAAFDGDTVLVADGTYTGEGNRDIDFLGKAITVRSESGPENCIIDCNGTEIDRHRGFYFHNNENHNAVVEGFTITNGNAYFGGGISCEESSPKITHCTITRNSADHGGGILCEWSNPTVSNCTITGNSADDGGGIDCYYSNPTITNCTISGNSSNSIGGGINCGHESNPTITNCIISGNSAYAGGGIYFEFSSNPTITNCTISGNAAGWFGGGIACVGSNPLITNCTITGNMAESGGGILCWRSSPTITNCIITDNSSGYSGGGMYCEGYSNPTITDCIINANYARGRGGGIYFEFSSSPTITNCTIVGNIADEGGGICCDYYSNPTITNCDITGNKAWGWGYGGAIYCGSSDPTITNCTISDNTAERGGGIYCRVGRPTITNCTFAENYAPDGRVLACDSYQQKYPSDVQLTNCILWDGGNEVWNNDSSTITITYSDIQGGYEGEGNIGADPCFVDAGYWADANDPNIVVEPNDPNAIWIDGDYYLLPYSLCIDAGDPNYVAEPNETDIDGNPRVINGRIDMGAYETNYIQAAMKLTPQMLNCNSKGKYVKAHLTLPEGFLPEDVDVNAPAMAEPIGAESEYIRVLDNDDGSVKLEICFDREAFCYLLTDDDSLEVTVIGSLTTSRYFYATDTIKIKP